MAVHKMARQQHNQEKGSDDSGSDADSSSNAGGAGGNANAGDDIIRVENLVKKFGSLTAVNGVSFSVKKGQVFAFLGPNGAGKTTTIKMLTTLLKPTAGTVRMNGFDPVREKNSARKSFGIVFQDPSVDEELTAYENMEYHGVLYSVEKNMRKKRIEHLLKMVDLWGREHDFVKTFSGGMKRRLEIARGLIHHPRILFLDEPTLGLDPQTMTSIWKHIKELNKKEGMTIFFTTHYMAEAESVANEVAVIDHGKIIRQGTVRQLKESTHSESLEAAFLKLTGKSIRDENSDPKDNMRLRRRMWRRR
jgi:ABC-2 type transport system ATP-binding protein